jgi:hypothetical protein
MCVEKSKVKPKRNSEVIWRKESPQTTLIFNPEDGNISTLNQTGSRIWELCDGEHTIEDVVNIIHEECGEPEHMIEEDAKGFLKELVNRKLLSLESNLS